MKPLDVFEPHGSDLHATQRWRYVVANDGCEVGPPPARLFAHMLLGNPSAQIGDGGCLAGRPDFADGIAAAVDVALEILRSLPRCRHAPVRKGADGVSPLKAVGLPAVVENKGNRAASGDAHAESTHLAIISDTIRARGWLQLAHDLIGNAWQFALRVRTVSAP